MWCLLWNYLLVERRLTFADFDNLEGHFIPKGNRLFYPAQNFFSTGVSRDEAHTLNFALWDLGAFGLHGEQCG